MKRLSIVLLFIALWAAPRVYAASSTITTNGSTCTPATNCLVVSLPQDKGGATLTLSGTWTGTISFEATGDGGVTWVAVSVTPLASTTTVTSATGNGTWQVNTSGFTGLRMRASAAITGAAIATITSSAASARGGSGGGGGGSMTWPTGGAGIPNYSGSNSWGTTYSATNVVPSNFLPVLIGDSGAGGTQGLVPAPAAGNAASNMFLGANGTWQVTSSTVNSQNGIISGGGVEWTSGYTYTVGQADYIIAGTEYFSPITGITLAAADPTNDRIDVIIVDTSSTVSAITGTAATNPQLPSVDPTTQLALTFVYVTHNTTSPPGNSNDVIYEEDTGPSAEWTATSSGSGWVLNSTNNPYAGTKDIEATAVHRTTYANLAKGSAVAASGYTQLGFYIRSKAAWPANVTLTIGFRLAGAAVGTAVQLRTGVFGFNSSNTTEYQQIIIPMAQFAVPVNLDTLRFTMTGTNGTQAIGFYLDNIILQTTGSGGGGGSGGITSLNAQTGATQTMVTGTTGTDFNISSAANIHTFNLPVASASVSGKLSSANWTTFNNKASVAGSTASTHLASWTAVGGQIQDGTTMVVPTGASLATSGTGTIAATKVTTARYVTTFPAIATAQTWASMAPYAATFPANFTTPTSTVKCGTNPGGTVVFTLRDVTTATDVGTVSVSSSCVGTFATTGGTTQAVSEDDYLTVVSGTDATAVNVVVDWKATQ